MTPRHRSVPPERAPSLETPPTTESTASTTSSMNLMPAASHESKLHAQAEALARMTLELQLRALASQSSHLERDIRTLVHRTENDHEYQQKNNKRLGEMMLEIHCVKREVAKMDKGSGDVRGEWEQYQALMATTMDAYKQEVVDLRQMVEGLSSQLDHFPSAHDGIEETQTLIEDPPVQQMETRAMAQKKKKTEEKGQKQRKESAVLGHRSQLTLPATAPPDEIRIKETLASTRRWNHDHKTTSLPDRQFVMNYLRQQSKRDPAMAVYIQRAIQRRIRNKQSRSPNQPRSRPQSLVDLCRNVSWQDVLQTVELVVKAQDKTLEALSQESEPK